MPISNQEESHLEEHEQLCLVPHQTQNENQFEDEEQSHYQNEFENEVVLKQQLAAIRRVLRRTQKKKAGVNEKPNGKVLKKAISKLSLKRQRALKNIRRRLTRRNQLAKNLKHKLNRLGHRFVEKMEYLLNHYSENASARILIDQVGLVYS